MMAASVAADTVPEYRTLMPTFDPRLMPESTISGLRGSTSAMAILTQSAGVPETAQPKKDPFLLTLLTRNGLSRLMACPTALCSLSGATTSTWCSSRNA